MANSDLLHIAIHADGLVKRAAEKLDAGNLAGAREDLQKAAQILKALDCDCAAKAEALAVRMSVAAKSGVGLC